MVKKPPAVWETWVRSLGLEDPLEKEMAAHSSILAWKIPWMAEPGRLLSTFYHQKSEGDRVHSYGMVNKTKHPKGKNS